MRNWNRREFVEHTALSLAALTTPRALYRPLPTAATVSLVRVGRGGRDQAIRTAVGLIGVPDLAGKRVALKPNFNSAHTFPGSTHPDTLNALVDLSHDLGASQVVVADRSGMGDVRDVMEDKGVFRAARQHRFEALPLQNLPADDWVRVEHPDLYWSRGFHVARVFAEADAIVQTCCLKTHRFGGHFTLSLKNSVGMVAKRVPGIDHDFMREMHRSLHQRHMIAELNLAYEPETVVLDAVDGFTDGGPEAGTVVHPGLILASRDRVAIDAVGVAILRDYGTTDEVARGTIFELEQIARATALGLGVPRGDQIRIVTADPKSARYAARLRDLLT